MASMPGRIIEGLLTVGVCNPVILLDEVDKLVCAASYHCVQCFPQQQGDGCGQHPQYLNLHQKIY